jgi:hypothetical protein
MAAIEARSLRAWLAYIKATKNTVCGRHPIACLLAAIERLDGQHATAACSASAGAAGLHADEGRAADAVVAEGAAGAVSSCSAPLPRHHDVRNWRLVA